MPNPIDDEDLYNAVILGGKRSPGTVKISGHDRKIGWDIKKGSGQTGATMTRSSMEPVAFTCTFYLVKDDAQGIDQFAEWPDFLALINSTVSGATPKALDIYHPDLAENDIKSVVKDTTVGTAHDGKGGETRVVKFVEYKPPKPAGGSPKGSVAKPEDDPNAAALAELAKLTKQYQDTPSDLAPHPQELEH